MIMLDGIRVRATELNSPDLNSVERIEVVQGGVIQLFSKKGHQGRLIIDFSSSISTNSLSNVSDAHKSAFYSFTI